jgi:hypothetical protein
VITTSHKGGTNQLLLAERFCKELGYPLVPREKLSLPALIDKYQVAGVIVAAPDKVFYYTGEEEFFFHPNMAAVRIKDIRSGKTDQMVKAMDLRPGDSVLDCTLGFGADAIVSAFVTGTSGTVLGLEVSPVIAALVRYGIKNYNFKSKLLSSTMRNITVINASHYEYLLQTAANSFDIVYFDPMFRQPKYKSSNMTPLRKLADLSPLNRDVLVEALRVARKRVVVKERRGSSEFARLGIDRIEGGKYAPVVYGVKNKDND